MPDPTRHPHRNENEPAPQFATAADFALADVLRRQLERRYFGAGGGPAAPPAANEDGKA
ncbi:MAG: hypothetical protein IPM22_13785 [Betaproteobacteria bacterium]|nr:hypothetical protein [Betaproteobacteria bacterium]